MNLNEAFRYQRYLDLLAQRTEWSIPAKDNAYDIVKKHLRSKADTDAEDFEEPVENENRTNVDDAIRLFEIIIKEKYDITVAINTAKAAGNFDVDALIQSNKYRRKLCGAIKTMLLNKSKTIIDTGRGYKFNAEGNQMPYTYDVEVKYSEAYDREYAKKVLKETVKEADKLSSDAELFLLQTDINFTPKFDVNMTFEDVMQELDSISDK